MASKDREERTRLNGSAPVSEVEAGPRFLYGSVVQVLVGPEEKRFDLHKELLCSISDFFSAALEGGFKESEAGAVKLPEQDVGTFKYRVHWLYTGKLTGYFRTKTAPSIKELFAEAVKAENLHYKKKPPEKDCDAMYSAQQALYLAMFEEAPLRELLSLHVFADALQVRGLKDHIVSTIVKAYGVRIFASPWMFHAQNPVVGNLPLPDFASTLSAAYESGPPTLDLRRFIADFFVNYVKVDAIAAKRGKLHSDLVYDILESYSKRRPEELYDEEVWDFEDDETICRYHEHDVECLLKDRDIKESQLTDW